MKKGTISKLHEYFFKNHQADAAIAIREFFQSEKADYDREVTITDREDSLFMEWITFDYVLQNGKKLIDNFISENPLKLSVQELEVYENLKMNKYGMFEILKVKIDEYIDLESLQSGKIYRVKEKMGTHDAELKTLLFCRVGKVDDHWELIGSDSVSYPLNYTERAKALLRQDKSQMTPKDTLKLLNRQNSKQPSKFEAGLNMSNEELEDKKEKIIAQLTKYLEKNKLLRGKPTGYSTPENKIKSTVQDILKTVFQAKGKPGDDTWKIIYMLVGSLKNPSQKVIDLVSDIWNYFPHKALGGLSPAQKVQEVYGKNSEDIFKSKKEINVTEINDLGLPAGAFLPLVVIVPELDGKDVKTIVLTEDKNGLRAGSYKLIENFCADRQCDCRKVMINLVNDKNEILATMGFGWEGIKYYEKWINDKKLAQEMTGAYLEKDGIQTEHSRECLRLFKKVLKDLYYVNCFRRHYKQFKASL